MRLATCCFLLLIVCSAPAAAQNAADRIADGSNPQIDYAAYVNLVAEVESLRAQRLLSMAGFRRVLDQQPDVLLLDARSAAAFAAGHIEGAINLPLPDFTPEALAQVIGPDQDRPILIYCNNNFSDDIYPIARKAVAVSLNTQTFVNLVAYGYRNVWELGETVPASLGAVRWIGTLADLNPPLLAPQAPAAR